LPPNGPGQGDDFEGIQLQPINHRYTRETAANTPQNLAYHIEDWGAAQNYAESAVLASRSWQTGLACHRVPDSGRLSRRV